MAEPENNHPQPGPVERNRERRSRAQDEPQQPQREPHDEEETGVSHTPVPAGGGYGYSEEDYTLPPRTPREEEDTLPEDADPVYADAYPEQGKNQEPVFAIPPAQVEEIRHRGPILKNPITRDMLYDDEDDLPAGTGAISAARKRRDIVLIAVFVFVLLALIAAIFLPTDFIWGRPEPQVIDPSEVEDIGLEKLENLNDLGVEREKEFQQKTQQASDPLLEDLYNNRPVAAPQSDIRELLAPTIGVTPPSPETPTPSPEPRTSPVTGSNPDPDTAAATPADTPGTPSPEEIQKELQALEQQVMEKMQDQETPE